MSNDRQTYVALLRGINVGGHHKVPMAELRELMTQMDFKNVQTLLNSGNVIFDGSEQAGSKIESLLAQRLEQSFGFTIPVLVRLAEEIKEIIARDPFRDIEVTKNIRLYVSLLKNQPETIPELPWTADNNSFRIIEISGRAIFSVLDLSVTTTPKGMEVLEKFVGKENITTRNGKTLVRIGKKLDGS